ncbi:Wadjet anti-phage system protein JetD domain-containing protein [Mycolicibacter heraklionensis]|uniref:Wadjet anti-phage system protein JetD domain-containing protein n=1 Tax=Mycolicibacter heraklionensis TaxID=512402 RepID=UPI000ADF6FCA
MTPADIAARVRRRWDDGSLLRGYAGGEPFAAIEVPLRGPKPSQIGDDLMAVREWVAELDAGRRADLRYGLEWQSVGGRQIGRNSIPVRAVVFTYEQAWALLGVASDVRLYKEILLIAQQYSPVRDWIIAHPHRALTLAADIPALISAYDWLDTHRGSQRYLREISAPGVDTKFAERHRPVLAAMLGVSSTAAGFLADLGLRLKPALVRLRPAPSLGLPGPLSELAVRPEELAQLAVQPRTALIVENEISYLSVDVPDDGVVLWGKGFEVDHVGRLPWLAGAEVAYWGDIDTHGFAILDRLRAWLPHARSVLMDRETLLVHRDRWGSEDRPATSVLTRLTLSEHDLYSELVTDGLGERVRLEQERIDWAWVEQRVSALWPGCYRRDSQL